MKKKNAIPIWQQEYGGEDFKILKRELLIGAVFWILIIGGALCLLSS